MKNVKKQKDKVSQYQKVHKHNSVEPSWWLQIEKVTYYSFYYIFHSFTFSDQQHICMISEN